MDELEIIIVHHRTPQLLKRCLEQLRAGAAGVPVVIVDTGPEPAYEVASAFAGIRLVTTANHSYAQAVNVGLKHASRAFVAQMNADLMVGPATFPDLLAALDRDGVGMVGPLCLTENRRRQAQGPLYALHYARLTKTRVNAVPVPWLSGSLQVFKRSLIEEVGGMDASFRFYNEDIEWCERVRRAGHLCMLVATEVLHVGGSATPLDPRFLIEGYRGGYRLSQRYRSAAFRFLHRAFVGAEAALKRRVSLSPHARTSYLAIAEMFRRQAFFESPFGATLTEANPDFLPGLESKI